MKKIKGYTPERLAEELGCWVARDGYDGKWMGHEAEPKIECDIWHYGGDSMSLEMFELPNTTWKDSLVAPPAPPVDWSKVSVDTPVIVWDSFGKCDFSYFGLNSQHGIFVFSAGFKSCDACTATVYEHSRLATSKEIAEHEVNK